jgi:predicted GNAT family acetyltransferase
MKNKLSILNREYIKSKELIYIFLRKVLPFKFSAKKFNWEYVSKKSIFCVLFDSENKVVLGTQGFIYHELEKDTIKIKSGKSETSYLDNKIRGKGHFKSLYNTAIEEAIGNNYKVIWGMTEHGAIWKRLGFDIYNEILFTTKITLRLEKRYSSNFFKHHIKKIISLVYVIKFHLFIFTKKSSKTFFLKKERDSTPTKEMEKLYNSELGNDIKLSLSQNFIYHRVIKSPSDCSCVYKFYRNNILIAYSFITIYESKAYILELICQNKVYEGVFIKYLLKDIYKNKNISSVFYFGNIKNPKVNSLFVSLRKVNGISKKSNLSFVIKNIGNLDFLEKEDIKKWYINGLWMEGINAW